MLTLSFQATIQTAICVLYLSHNRLASKVQAESNGKPGGGGDKGKQL